ncbi:MAG: sarcosine oxidase subunit delta [Gemmobacter sp.]
MLMLTCPACGVTAEETEFLPGGAAHLRRIGPEGDDAAFEAYLFTRANPRGVHLERWRHAYGCGKWFHAARCTATLEVFGTYPAHLPEPPAAVRARIAARQSAGGAVQAAAEGGAAGTGDDAAGRGAP